MSAGVVKSVWSYLLTNNHAQDRQYRLKDKAVAGAAVNEATKKLATKMSDPNIENDANERAAKKLGGKDKMPYTYGQSGYNISLH